MKYKRLEKQRSMMLSQYVNPVTGCIHSGMDQLGAATGRTSSSKPNAQQVSGRVKVLVSRPMDNLFPSSAKAI
jgi:DNA polymerase I-like protein with 3'-5' exonuclease and polymerase domains